MNGIDAGTIEVLPYDVEHHAGGWYVHWRSGVSATTAGVRHSRGPFWTRWGAQRWARRFGRRLRGVS